MGTRKVSSQLILMVSLEKAASEFEDMGMVYLWLFATSVYAFVTRFGEIWVGLSFVLASLLEMGMGC